MRGRGERMVGGAAEGVTATDLVARWQRSAGSLSNLDLERLVAFDRPLWSAQLFMKRHHPGIAEKEVLEGLDRLKKPLVDRLPGLDTAIRFPAVGSSQQAINAAIDQAGVVRTAVRILAGLPR